MGKSAQRDPSARLQLFIISQWKTLVAPISVFYSLSLWWNGRNKYVFLAFFSFCQFLAKLSGIPKRIRINTKNLWNSFAKQKSRSIFIKKFAKFGFSFWNFYSTSLTLPVCDSFWSLCDLSLIGILLLFVKSWKSLNQTFLWPTRTDTQIEKFTREFKFTWIRRRVNRNFIIDYFRNCFIEFRAVHYNRLNSHWSQSAIALSMKFNQSENLSGYEMKDEWWVAWMKVENVREFSLTDFFFSSCLLESFRTFTVFIGTLIASPKALNDDTSHAPRSFAEWYCVVLKGSTTVITNHRHRERVKEWFSLR